MELEKIRIKITSTPEGDAPQEVREKWIGLELNGIAYKSGTLIGPGPDSLSGFITFIDSALSALRIHNQKAFEWWSNWQKEHPDPEIFFFNSECYKVMTPKEFVEAFERENQAFLKAFRGPPLEELVNYMMKH